MNSRMQKSKWTEAQREVLAKSLKDNKKNEEAGKDFDFTLMAESAAETYQIVPLTMPTKANGFLAVNAYVDNVGRVKELSRNARASRLCSDDIRGDCFLSRTFDDETDFRRCDFDRKDFDQFLENPPSAKGRWNPAAINFEDAIKGKGSEKNEGGLEKKCASCFKGEKDIEGMLRKCGKCGSVLYCSVDCQRKDWKFHKRNCVA